MWQQAIETSKNSLTESKALASCDEVTEKLRSLASQLEVYEPGKVQMDVKSLAKGCSTAVDLQSMLEASSEDSAKEKAKKLKDAIEHVAKTIDSFETSTKDLSHHVSMLWLNSGISLVLAAEAVECFWKSAVQGRVLFRDM